MSKELKYVLIAAVIIGTMAAVIVMRTRSIDADEVQPLVIEEEMVDVDSSAVEPESEKDAKLVQETNDTAMAEGEVETPEKKSPATLKESNKVDEVKTTRNNEKPSLPKVAPVKTPVVKADRYAVQTAALSTAGAAKAAEAMLQSKGFTGTKTVNKGGRFVVYAGTFADEASAIALKKKLDQKHIDSFVKRIN